MTRILGSSGSAIMASRRVRPSSTASSTTPIASNSKATAYAAKGAPDCRHLTASNRLWRNDIRPAGDPHPGRHQSERPADFIGIRSLASAKILARQACYRPVMRDGLPLIGRVPGVAGAYIATGHSVWGILNAPATGEAIAELIVDGAAHAVDLAPFDPGRLARLDPARLRLGT